MLIERLLVRGEHVDQVVHQGRQSMLAIDALPRPDVFLDVQPDAVTQQPEVLHDGFAGGQTTETAVCLDPKDVALRNRSGLNVRLDPA